ncbi:hypothetical protein R6Q59_012676 [Mikania micrantha]
MGMVSQLAIEESIFVTNRQITEAHAHLDERKALWHVVQVGTFNNIEQHAKGLTTWLTKLVDYVTVKDFESSALGPSGEKTAVSKNLKGSRKWVLPKLRGGETEGLRF